MSPCPPRRLVRRLAVSALVGTVAAGAAGAQPFTERFVVGGIQAATAPPAGAACGTPISASGPGVTSAACNFNGATFSMVGRALDGRVGALAGVVASPPGGPFGSSYDAQGRGQWGDRLTFTGLLPATMQMNVRWDGTLEAHASGGSGVNVQANWLFQASGTGGIGGGEYHNGREFVVVGTPINATPTDALEAVHDQKSIVMDVVPSSTTAPPYFDFLLNVFAHVTVVGGTNPGTGSALVDFEHTGLVASLAFFDAAGNDITGSVPYTFSRGTLVGPVVTTAPEPATVTLVTGGLLALAGVARRRRAPRS